MTSWWIDGSSHLPPAGLVLLAAIAAGKEDVKSLPAGGKIIGLGRGKADDSYYNILKTSEFRVFLTNIAKIVTMFFIYC